MQKLLSFSFGVLLVFYVLFGVFRCFFVQADESSLFYNHTFCLKLSHFRHTFYAMIIPLFHTFWQALFIYFSQFISFFYFILSILYTIFKFIVNLDFFDIGISFNLN